MSFAPMPTLLWIPATIAAAAFQVARNALQRSLLPSTGPWGATLVRFLFGLPFSLIFLGIAVALSPGIEPRLGADFWPHALSGALAQVLATASLLVAMRRSGFAVGTAMQQSSLPLAAVLGLIVFRDSLSLQAWIGVAVTTAGLFALTWPDPKTPGGTLISGGALFGLASGACFGFSINAFRHAAIAMEPDHPAFAAIASVTIVQAVQAAGLALYLLIRDRGALAAILCGWKNSLGAGLFGACASSAWFFALALAPAASVRALAVIETPIAAIAGRKAFRERLSPRQMIAGAAVMIGVILTTVGA
jgi:drug/metabolite transporter (DMT)-like permease